MFNKPLKCCICLSLLALSACVTIPQGPSVMVVPESGKPFELFMQEDASCRRWAEQQIGISPQGVVDNNATFGAIAGTAIGAGLGALIGAASGHAGAGAAIGGVGGMLIGASSGANSGQIYGREAQRRYDVAYLQCMYAKGNQIPVSNGRTRQYYRTRAILPPPPVYQPSYYESVSPPSPGGRSPYYESVPPPPPGAKPQTPPELLDNKGRVQ